MVAFSHPSRNIRPDSCQIRNSADSFRILIEGWRNGNLGGACREREIVGGGDGEARYRRGKTGEREGGSRYGAILTRHPFALVARYLEV